MKAINAGAVAWLRKSRYSSGPFVVIPVGTTLTEFCRLIEHGGGAVYLKREAINAE